MKSCLYWSRNKSYVAYFVERYTMISKILFVSLFYAILTPMSLFISCIAFIFLFNVDRYLLLRLWIIPPMMNADVAKRLREQMLLCVAAHMFITNRFIYSWPMDEAFVHDMNTTSNTTTTIIEKVNKYPDRIYFYLSPNESWQSRDQQRLLFIYQIATAIICLLVIYLWIIYPLIKAFRQLFFKQVNILGDASNAAFSSLSLAFAFVPIIEVNKASYIYADTSMMLPQHKPALSLSNEEIHLINNKYLEAKESKKSNTYAINDVDASQLDKAMQRGDVRDISKYIPQEYHRKVLAIVKWYDDSMQNISKDVDTLKEDNLQPLPVTTFPTTHLSTNDGLSQGILNANIPTIQVPGNQSSSTEETVVNSSAMSPSATKMIFSLKNAVSPTNKETKKEDILDKPIDTRESMKQSASSNPSTNKVISDQQSKLETTQPQMSENQAKQVALPPIVNAHGDKKPNPLSTSQSINPSRNYMFSEEERDLLHKVRALMSILLIRRVEQFRIIDRHKLYS